MDEQDRASLARIDERTRNTLTQTGEIKLSIKSMEAAQSETNVQLATHSSEIKTLFAKDETVDSNEKRIGVLEQHRSKIIGIGTVLVFGIPLTIKYWPW